VAQNKQLSDVRIEDVLEKRRLDQLLGAKEFAVLPGISYSNAREWFHASGFPVFRGVVFCGDFVEWRRRQTGLSRMVPNQSSLSRPAQLSVKTAGLTPRVAGMLAQA
jgi:hypothetical protein